MNPSPELKKKLKACGTEVCEYVIYLQLENTKFQKRIAKLEAERLTDKNRVAALEKQLKKGPVHNIKVSFVSAKSRKPA